MRRLLVFRPVEQVLRCAAGLLLVGALPVPGRAQAPPVDWAVPCASGPAPYVWGPSKLVVDRQGNTYVAGAFNGTTVIGPGSLTAVPSTDGAYAGDVFVAKLNAQGQYLWAVSAGGNKLDMIKGLAVDALGDVYVTGSFESFSLGFGAGGPVLFNSSARSEWFVAKLSGATGQWLWARRAGGAYADEGTGIAVNAAGEVYVTGNIAGPSGTACDVGPFALAPVGGGDVVVAKLSPSGAWLWARNCGGAVTEQATALLLDSAGNLYVTGSFYFLTGQPITTQLGPSTFRATPVVGCPTPNRPGDLFVGKLDGAGNWLWAVQGDAVNGQNLAGTVGLTADGLGHLYVAGIYANQSVRLGPFVLPNLSVMQPPLVPGPPVPYTNNYHTDVFVARLDAATGAWQWAVRAGGSQHDYLGTIAADPQGRVYVGARGRPGVFEGFANPLAPSGGPVYSAELAGATGAWRWTAPEGAWTLATDATGRL